MLDNELIHQKNHLLDLINEGKKKEALLLLKFVEEMWRACNYGYKVEEVRERCKKSA